MATLSNRNGVRQVQWMRGNRKLTLSLGRIAAKQAQVIRNHVEQLIAKQKSGQPLPPDTAGWLGVVGQDLYQRLYKLELVSEQRGEKRRTIKAHCEAYLEARKNLKERTVSNMKQSIRELKKHFGEGRCLDTITKGDARDFKRALDERYAPSSVTGWMKKAQQIFEDAKERELIKENPFRGIKLAPQVNEARNQYVPASDVMTVIGYCPDIQWKLIFALARFAGLRIPSEIRGLKWSSIFWDRNRMRIESPKTEGHHGKDHRIIPIFPDVLPFLREAFEMAEAGAAYVFPRLRRVTNHSTTGKKIIRRAGLNPWSRVFQNLRASCETDLATVLPLHVACKFIGNSEKVAMKHYTSVNEEHFAAGSALHFALQPAPDRGSLGGTPSAKTPGKTPESVVEMPATVVQLPRFSSRNQQKFHNALQSALHPKQLQGQRLLGRCARKYKLTRSPMRRGSSRKAGAR